MHCYICKLESEMKLLEHSDACWLGASELDSVGWLAADIEVVAAIRAAGVIWEWLVVDA